MFKALFDVDNKEWKTSLLQVRSKVIKSAHNAFPNMCNTTDLVTKLQFPLCL